MIFRGAVNSPFDAPVMIFRGVVFTFRRADHAGTEWRNDFPGRGDVTFRRARAIFVRGDVTFRRAGPGFFRAAARGRYFEIQSTKLHW